MADIEKMFHQVNVKEEDAEALRFLWWPEGDFSKQPVEHQMAVHLFGAISSPSCCSYALKRTEAVHVVKELPKLLSRRGFRLTRWSSNEREVLTHVPDSERAPCLRLQLENLPKDSALGVRWNMERDSLGFRSGNLKANTRRGILSFVASVYDPLRLVAPVVFPAKLMMQGLCRRDCGWDEEIPKGTVAEWQTRQEEFQSLATIEIPRC